MSQQLIRITAFLNGEPSVGGRLLSFSDRQTFQDLLLKAQQKFDVQRPFRRVFVESGAEATEMDEIISGDTLYFSFGEDFKGPSPTATVAGADVDEQKQFTDARDRRRFLTSIINSIESVAGSLYDSSSSFVKGHSPTFVRVNLERVEDTVGNLASPWIARLEQVASWTDDKMAHGYKKLKNKTNDFIISPLGKKVNEGMSSLKSTAASTKDSVQDNASYVKDKAGDASQAFYDAAMASWEALKDKAADGKIALDDFVSGLKTKMGPSWNDQLREPATVFYTTASDRVGRGEPLTDLRTSLGPSWNNMVVSHYHPSSPYPAENFYRIALECYFTLAQNGDGYVTLPDFIAAMRVKLGPLWNERLREPTEDVYRQFREELSVEAESGTIGVSDKIATMLSSNQGPMLSSTTQSTGPSTTTKIANTASELSSQAYNKAADIGSKASETASSMSATVSQKASELGSKASETAAEVLPKAKEVGAKAGAKAAELGSKAYDVATDVSAKVANKVADMFGASSGPGMTERIAGIVSGQDVERPETGLFTGHEAQLGAVSVHPREVPERPVVERKVEASGLFSAQPQPRESTGPSTASQIATQISTNVPKVASSIASNVSALATKVTEKVADLIGGPKEQTETSSFVTSPGQQGPEGGINDRDITSKAGDLSSNRGSDIGVARSDVSSALGRPSDLSLKKSSDISSRPLGQAGPEGAFNDRDISSKAGDMPSWKKESDIGRERPMSGDKSLSSNVSDMLSGEGHQRPSGIQGDKDYKSRQHEMISEGGHEFGKEKHKDKGPKPTAKVSDMFGGESHKRREDKPLSGKETTKEFFSGSPSSSSSLSSNTSSSLGFGTSGSLHSGTFSSLRDDTSGSMGSSTSGAMYMGTSSGMGSGTSSSLGHGTSSSMGRNTSSSLSSGSSSSLGFGTSSSIGRNTSSSLSSGSSGSFAHDTSSSTSSTTVADIFGEPGRTRGVRDSGLGSGTSSSFSPATSSSFGSGTTSTFGLGTTGGIGSSTSSSLGYGTSSSLAHGTSSSLGYGTSSSLGHGTSSSLAHGTSSSLGHGTSSSLGYGTSGSMGGSRDTQPIVPPTSGAALGSTAGQASQHGVGLTAPPTAGMGPYGQTITPPGAYIAPVKPGDVSQKDTITSSWQSKDTVKGNEAGESDYLAKNRPAAEGHAWPSTTPSWSSVAGGTHQRTAEMTGDKSGDKALLGKERPADTSSNIAGGQHIQGVSTTRSDMPASSVDTRSSGQTAETAGKGLQRQEAGVGKNVKRV